MLLYLQIFYKNKFLFNILGNFTNFFWAELLKQILKKIIKKIDFRWKINDRKEISFFIS